MPSSKALRYGAVIVARLGAWFLLLFGSAMTGSCAEELDIPTPPDFDEVLVAYARPDAEVSSAVMAAVGDELLDLRQQVEQSEVFDEILDLVVDVQGELYSNTDEYGNLVIPGLGSFEHPNAVLEINHNCSGWGPTDAEARGSVQLNMVLERGDILPVVWGDATQCRFLASRGDIALQSSYDGQIAVHFGEKPIPTGQALRALVITFIVQGALGVEGRDLAVRRSFRLRDIRELEILWQLKDGRSFVYLFNLETLRQGIRDANCTGEEGCSCNLEERECTLPSGSISW